MDKLSEPVIYHPVVSAPGQGPIPNMRGIFDARHEVVDLDGEGMEISSTAPVLGIREVEYPAGHSIKQGDQFTVRGQEYDVFDLQPDGQGGLKIRLKERS